MRISFIALGFPPDLGGTETYNVEVARKLVERGHDVRVFTWPPEGPEGAAAADAALPFEVRRAPCALDRGAAGLDDALAAWSPEVVLAARSSRGLRGALRVAAARAPVVLVVHDLRGKHRRRSFFNRWRVRRGYGLDLAREVVASSEHTRRRLLDLGVPEERATLVYPGIETAAFAPDEAAGAEARRRHALEGRRLIATVARIAPNKGHAQVIAALPALARRFPEIGYLVVGGGDGDLRAALERRAADLGVAERVVFTGRVADPRPYYNACDVFVMPSRPASEDGFSGEGFGIAYVEAGACGKPVVASSHGGGAEIVLDGETGRVIDPGRPEVLAAAVEDILSDPARAASMGERARERARRYDWAASVAALEGVLRKASACA